jgi:hypothetical protein
MTAPYTIDGAIDGPSFLAYVEQVLAPTLHKGDIVFMDNLRAHKIASLHRNRSGLRTRFPTFHTAKTHIGNRGRLLPAASCGAQSLRTWLQGADPIAVDLCAAT